MKRTLILLTALLLAPLAALYAAEQPKLPTVDISGETNRHVIIAQGTDKEWQGHPHTVLLPDGKTMFCVWQGRQDGTSRHGAPNGLLKRSDAGALKSGRVDEVRREIAEFVGLAKGRALTKIILEVCFLTDEEIVTGCRLIQEAGADYAKTSTGQFEGPSMGQVLLMRETLKGSGIKLKVAGVKFPRPQNAYAFITAGAELIGTRAASEIIQREC